MAALVGGVASPASAHQRVASERDVTKYLQRTLENVYGIEIGPIDGIYGKRTRAGVRTLQVRFNLRIKNGRPTSETWDCLQWCRMGAR